MANEKTFSPVSAAFALGGDYGHSGINWSYMRFHTKQAAEAFDKQCNDNGFRTRYLCQLPGEDMWSVQYHHYQD
jgi:hypothetical protein